uniref:Uncharacterized protein n=1 Tax=Odontella aurita TaxID=265563 RepID=A0A7S4IL90_9STRA
MVPPPRGDGNGTNETDPSMTHEPTSKAPIEMTRPVVRDIHLALVSSLQSIASSALLGTPQSIKSSCLSPDLFPLAFCRKLRLPILHRPMSCSCDKLINIYGDHHFDCQNHSKMVLHNRTRDAYFIAFRRVAPYCQVVERSDNILLDPTGLAHHYPRKRPADVALRLTHKLFHILEIDFTIAGTPNAAATFKDQPRKNSSNLRNKEIHKWRGTTRTKSNKPNADGTTHDTVLGKSIIQDLLRQVVILVPTAFDPFITCGDAFRRHIAPEWIPHHYSRPDFGRADGANIGYRISRTSRQSHIRGLFHSDDEGWKATHGRKMFGSAYLDASPSA